MRIALIAEGCYPFVTGGVSTWCDQLVRGLSEHEFEVVAITATSRNTAVMPVPDNVRSDASAYPASVLGSSNGWPGERWVDVRQWEILGPILAARFDRCRQKGFDAVDPDHMDGYSNSTGLPITAAA